MVDSEHVEEFFERGDPLLVTPNGWSICSDESVPLPNATAAITRVLPTCARTLQASRMTTGSEAYSLAETETGSACKTRLRCRPFRTGIRAGARSWARSRSSATAWLLSATPGSTHTHAGQVRREEVGTSGSGSCTCSSLSLRTEQSSTGTRTGLTDEP